MKSFFPWEPRPQNLQISEGTRSRNSNGFFRDKRETTSTYTSRFSDTCILTIKKTTMYIDF